MDFRCNEESDTVLVGVFGFSNDVLLDLRLPLLDDRSLARLLRLLRLERLLLEDDLLFFVFVLEEERFGDELGSKSESSLEDLRVGKYDCEGSLIDPSSIDVCRFAPVLPRSFGLPLSVLTFCAFFSPLFLRPLVLADLLRFLVPVSCSLPGGGDPPLLGIVMSASGLEDLRLINELPPPPWFLLV